MPSAPTITLISTNALNEIIADKFWYELYADDENFAVWTEWAKDSVNASDVTYNMADNADAYSGYVMKIRCDVNSVTTSK